MKRTVKKRPEKKKAAAARGTKRVATRKKRSSVPTLTKFTENPIISPQHQNSWEAWQTFNPGVILLEDKVHFLYRAVGEDGISRLGYALSEDGFTINERFPYPVYEHRVARSVFNYYSFASGGSFGGAEDPRIVRVDGEDILYMTYTACDNGLGVALTSIQITDFLNPAPEQVRYGASKKWTWKTPRLISKPGEVHKNWVIFPEKINNRYAVLHSICPEISVAYRDDLEFREGEYIESYYDGNMRRRRCWDNWLRGAGAPPIQTRAGWLLFYQAMDESDPGRYKTGVMLLDLDDPAKILHRSSEPVLEPEEDYENNGFKPGVIYVTGAVVKNGELLVYYGAADSYVGVAHADLEEFLEVLVKEAKPKLKLKNLKVKIT